MDTSREDSLPVNPKRRPYRRPRFSPTEELAIITDFQSGLTVPKLMKRYGGSQCAVVGVLHRHGLRQPPRGTERRRYFFDETFFENIDTEEKAYWLGFIAADGCVTDKKWCLSIGLAQCDRGHLEKFAKAIKTTHPVSDITTKGDEYGERHASRVYIWSKKLANQLIRLGVTPRKSLTAEPWNAPPRLARAYWQGAFDGDGCISKSVRRRRRNRDGGGRTEWTVSFCGSLPMVTAFRNFVREHLGVSAEPSRSQSIFVVAYSGGSLPQKVAKLLYSGASVWLDRKKSLVEKLLNHVFTLPKHALLTPDGLKEMRAELGSWAAVAKAVDTSYTVLCGLRNRLGMTADVQKYAHVTREMLESLHAELKTWKDVATRLGMHYVHVFNLRHKFGMMD